MICGIDPGFKGGIAFLGKDGECGLHEMPVIGTRVKDLNITELIKILRSYKLDMVFIEHVWAFPRSGSKASFRFGEQLGILRGVVATMEIPSQLVRPQTWQKCMYEGVHSGFTEKQRSFVACQRLYPKLDLGGHDGKADALLIATYGNRVN